MPSNTHVKRAKAVERKSNLESSAAILNKVATKRAKWPTKEADRDCQVTAPARERSFGRRFESATREQRPWTAQRHATAVRELQNSG
jgi:hypothetical protein